MELDELLPILQKLRLKNKRLGFTCSCFDILHAGHYLMLEDSKQQCDVLIVGLQTDPTIDEKYRVTTGGKNKNKPIQSYQERLIQIEGCRYVDLVVQYSTEEDLMEILKSIDPDIRILGTDWKGKPYTGHELDIPVHWHVRNHNYSTSELRRQVYYAEKKKLGV